MPSCYCRWARCDGKTISKRSFDDHQRHDRRAQFNSALEAENQATQRQDAEIASYITSLTLTEEAAGDSSSFGGRLWAREANASSEPLNPRSPTQLSITEALQTIREVQSELGPLATSVNIALLCPSKPITPADVFPLRQYLRDAYLLQYRLKSVNVYTAPVQEVRRQAAEGVDALLAELKKAEHQWSRELKILPHKGGTAESFDTRHHFNPMMQGVDPIIQVSIFTVIAMQIAMHVSRRGCHFLFSMLRYIVQLALLKRNPFRPQPLSDSDLKILSEFPVDPDSASRKLPLNGHEVILAVCPNAKCHKTYPPIFEGNSPIPVYPLYCTHAEFSTASNCGTRLTCSKRFGDKQVEVPIKRFVSFSFKDFVANLTSRPGFEDMMDTHSNYQGNVMRDLSDGRYLREIFRGPDGAPFQSTGEAARYIFSLSVDFFNPFTNKQAGKKSSVGIISVACLSLPPSQRYKPENMFLAGIIPGPNEPPLTAINHYLTPIVDDLEEFWTPGVRFTRTFNHPEGRLVCCALLLVVCDLLAARKAAGFAACTHEHFCSVCRCTRSHEGYGNTDYKSWTWRTNVDCREAAQKYLDADTAEERLHEFNESGVRWTELLRLSYFDISRCVIVDSMHNLFLGLVKEHFKGILGISLPSFKEKAFNITFEAVPDSMSANERKGVEKLRTWLEEPASLAFPTREKGIKKLTGIHMNSLAFVCRTLGCSPTLMKARYYKKDYAAELLAWRLRQAETAQTGSNSSMKHGHVLKEAEMIGIRADLKSIATPSWLPSIPINLGSAAHGKLKADQWRVLGTVHLPMSLTRLWSRHVNQTSEHPRSLHCHTILLVTMALVSAVILATARTISPENAAAYRDYMLAYLEGIQLLFPDYHMRPNHHMALHIYDYLLLFGPVHSWWTFPFERMIGAVQRVPNNSKIGELEETIARAYTRSANLRAIIVKSGCPDVIKHSESFFRRLVDLHTPDSLTTDLQAFPLIFGEEIPAQDVDDSSEILQTFPEELQLALDASISGAPVRGQLLPNIRIGGLNYSTSSQHEGNSCVLISELPGSMEETPAQIAYIVESRATGVPEIYLGIRRYKPANLPQDPFASFLVLRSAMWDADLGNLGIIRPSQVLSHFARLPVYIDGRPLIATLSLSRVFKGSAAEHASNSLRDIRLLRERQAN